MSLKPEYYGLIFAALLLGACSSNPSQNSSDNTYPANPSAPDKTAYRSQAAIFGSPVKAGQQDQSRHRRNTDIVHTDIWQRIGAGLQLPRHLPEQRTQDKLAFYAGKQEYLDRVAERATPYIFHIVEALEQRDMPLDLALLPVVESAYQPFAYSPSHAAGIWQFIPSTGRYFGLKQNSWYDGRRDIITATDAALNYLQKLHTLFDGDWLLAIAAYNAGERTIERAIEQNRNKGLPTDFWSLKLRRETMHYVPSLLALAELVAVPEQYQISLSPIANQPYFDIVDVGSQIDLDTVSDMTGMSIDELLTLNPGIKKWATDPEGPHHLLLPLDKSPAFQRKLAALPPHERVKWQVYQVRQGDNLGKIAHLFRTDVKALKEANKLQGNLIRTGHTLLIPSPHKPSHVATTTQYNTSRRQADPAQRLVYTVQTGDSLWAISRRHGVTVEQICEWNGINRRTVLTPGKTLFIYQQVTEELLATADVAETQNQRVSYTVQNGDSLWLIARRFDVTVEQLQHWNRMNRQTQLQPGQSLEIYVSSTATDV